MGFFQVQRWQWSPGWQDSLKHSNSFFFWKAAGGTLCCMSLNVGQNMSVYIYTHIHIHTIFMLWSLTNSNADCHVSGLGLLAFELCRLVLGLEFLSSSTTEPQKVQTF